MESEIVAYVSPLANHLQIVTGVSQFVRCGCSAEQVTEKHGNALWLQLVF